MHRVLVKSIASNRLLLWAAFRVEIHASIYADELRRANPTWTVVQRDPRVNYRRAA
jgi:transposase-like protein